MSELNLVEALSSHRVSLYGVQYKAHTQRWRHEVDITAVISSIKEMENDLASAQQKLDGEQTESGMCE